MPNSSINPDIVGGAATTSFSLRVNEGDLRQYSEYEMEWPSPSRPSIVDTDRHCFDSFIDKSASPVQQQQQQQHISNLRSCTPFPNLACQFATTTPRRYSPFKNACAPHPTPPTNVDGLHLHYSYIQYQDRTTEGWLVAGGGVNN